MTTENNVTLSWHECMSAVCNAAKGKTGNIAYAAGYASAGRRMYDDGERRVQALYILNNITHWRGDEAKRVRTRLKEFARD